MKNVNCESLASPFFQCVSIYESSSPRKNYSLHQSRKLFKFISLTDQGLSNIYGLLTKCEVKMAGYWPSSSFAFLFDTVSVHKHAKKELGQYPAILTAQAWSIKDLLYAFRGKFSCHFQAR